MKNPKILHKNVRHSRVRGDRMLDKYSQTLRVGLLAERAGSTSPILIKRIYRELHNIQEPIPA